MDYGHTQQNLNSSSADSFGTSITPGTGTVSKDANPDPKNSLNSSNSSVQWGNQSNNQPPQPIDNLTAQLLGKGAIAASPELGEIIDANPEKLSQHTEVLTMPPGFEDDSSTEQLDSANKTTDNTATIDFSVIRAGKSGDITPGAVNAVERTEAEFKEGNMSTADFYDTITQNFRAKYQESLGRKPAA